MSTRQNSTLETKGKTNKKKVCKSLIVNFFTLIELLISIGIIAILAALLLPTLNKVREKARAIDCTGRLKQWGTAASFYHSDHDGRPCPSREEDGTEWNDILAPYLDRARNDVTFPEMKDKRNPNALHKCPTFNEMWGSSGTNYRSDYVINIDVAPFWYKTYWYEPGHLLDKISRLRKPTRTLFLGDGFWNRSQIAYVQGTRVMGGLPWDDTHTRVSYRHNKMANLLLMDGHVQAFHMPIILNTYLDLAYHGGTYVDCIFWE